MHEVHIEKLLDRRDISNTCEGRFMEVDHARGRHYRNIMSDQILYIYRRRTQLEANDADVAEGQTSGAYVEYTWK